MAITNIFTREKLEFLQNVFADCNTYCLLKETRDIYFSLDRLIAADSKNVSGELLGKYRFLKAKFGFLIIHTLPEKDFFNLFENSLDAGFAVPEYDFWDNVKKYLVIIPDYDARDKIKERLRNILVKNKAKITPSGLSLGSEKASGTAENWFRDYHSNLGTGVADKLKFEQYFIASPNIKALTQEEKTKIKSFFQFYERLKLSSKTPQGFEEEMLVVVNDELKIWKDGRAEDIDPEAKKAVEELRKGGFLDGGKTPDTAADAAGSDAKLAELEKIAAEYPAGSLERKAVEEEIRKLEGRS
jgi:hypothetical protein